MTTCWLIWKTCSRTKRPPPPQPAPAPAKRNFAAMMRRILVTPTLEVGSAKLTPQDLAEIERSSVIEPDTLAGEPPIIKVNGTVIGRAEVVVSGENYGLKVVEPQRSGSGS